MQLSNPWALRSTLIALLCLIPMTTNGQSQPLSKSMAECGGLMLAASEMISDSERRDELVSRAQAWASAGVEQARSEGHIYPDFFVENSFRGAFEEWLNGGRLNILSEDFRDWTQYCRSLAAARGLDLDQR